MSDEPRTISIPLRRMTQAELDSFLETAADILRGNVDHSEFRGYVFALLFFKRISDITIERAKRVIQQKRKYADSLLPGDVQRQFADSLGFKVYTLAKSRFPRVEFAPDPEKTEAENVEALKRYITEKESSFHIQLDKEPVRDEVLLKQGFMFDYTLTPQPGFTKNEVVLVRDANKESLLCLDATIEPETVDYFQTHTDRFFICLEIALDTTKKWNLKHHLADKLKTI